MTAKEFIDLLRHYLDPLPKEIIDDIVNDYQMHFAEAAREGIPEWEVAQKLGSPELIARDYLSQDWPIKENTRHWWADQTLILKLLIIVLLLIGGVVAVPVIASIVIAFYAVIISFIIAGGTLVLLAGCVFLSVFMPHLFTGPYANLWVINEWSILAKLFATLGLAILGWIIITVMIRVGRMSLRGIRDMMYRTVWWLHRRK